MARYEKTVFNPIRTQDVTPEAKKARGPHSTLRLELLPEHAGPRADKPIRAVGEREKALWDKIEKFKDRGMLRDAKGQPQWVARAFLVPKPGKNDWRLVIDYRHLNSCLKGNSFPLPVIEDQIANQEGNFIFSIIGLEDGFHQMHLEESSKHLTAFCTPFGIFEWNVLPMGVKVGPAAYQQMVQYVTRNCPQSRPYIDEILSSSGRNVLEPDKLTIEQKQQPGTLKKYFEAHYEDLCKMFDALEEAQLTVKPSKVHLFKRIVQYVGHILKDGCRYPSPTKISAVKEWKWEDIKTAKHMKGLLGLVGWYQVYIDKFAQMAAPLMNALKGKYQYEPRDPNAPRTSTGVPQKRKKIKLTPKEARIHWTDEMKTNFEALKNVLTEKTRLFLPKPGLPWRIITDASNYAVGGVLEQQQEDGNWHPVAFYSGKLQGNKAGVNGSTKNTGQFAWTPREQETYAIVCCLLKFQSWIGGSAVEIQTDHSAIVKWYKEDLCTISGPLGRRGRWHEFLSRFNLIITYRPGQENQVADALSRFAYPAGEAQDTNFHGGDDDLAGWEEAEKQEWQSVRDYLKTAEPEAFSHEQAMLNQLQVATVAALQAVKSVNTVEAEAPYVATDGSKFSTLEELFIHSVGDESLAGPSSRCQTRPQIVNGRKYTRAQKKRLNLDSKCRHKAQLASLNMIETMSSMSWHMPGVKTLVVGDIEAIKVPPAISVLYDDWSSHYELDPFFAPHWDALRQHKFIEVDGQSYTLHNDKVRSNGRVCVPYDLVKQVIKACHEYAHPGIRKTLEIFNRKYSCAYQLKELHQMVQSIVNKCNICGQTKGRKGLQPESNHPAPIPEYPFASVCVDFCDLSGSPCTANGNTYDYVLVVVCRLTGYVVAVPCSKTLTALGLADLYLERVVPVMGMPQEIFSDQDHLVTAEFFSELCKLSGISMKQSTIKRPQSNGRAERAVQVVVESLRQWLVKTTQQNWAQLLPLAIWASNDIPGPISGYSPHYLVFGRNPIGFGDCPPILPQSECRDAVGFFQQLVQDRRYVQDSLNKIHRRKAEEFRKAHPPHVYVFGEKVWYRDYKTKKGTDKLHRVWEGPGEVLQRLGSNTYLIATERGEMALDTMRLKPYVAPEEGTPPLHYYTDQDFLVESDKYVIEDIVSHTTVGRGRRKHIEWEVKYRGYPETEFQPASAFMHDINDLWTQYNKKHKIDLQLSDIRQVLARSAPNSTLDAEFEARLVIQTTQRTAWRALVASFKNDTPF